MVVPCAGQVGDASGDGRPLVFTRTGDGAVSMVGVNAAVGAVVGVGEELELVPQPAMKRAARAVQPHPIGLVYLSIAVLFNYRYRSVHYGLGGGWKVCRIYAPPLCGIHLRC